MTLLMVMLGAAVGAPCRWLLDQAIQSRHDSVFPWGTWTINVLGSLLLGVILSLAHAGHASTAAVALLGTGFCGGFTTYSTFSYETVRLLQEGSRFEALLNVTASVTIGFLAATAGWYATQALWG